MSKRAHIFYTRPGGVDGPGKHLWWFRVLPFIPDEDTVLNNALGTTCRYFAEEVLPCRLAIMKTWTLVGGYTCKAIARVLARCPNLLLANRRSLERRMRAQAACEAQHAEISRRWTRYFNRADCCGFDMDDEQAFYLCEDYLKGVPSDISSNALNDIFKHLNRVVKAAGSLTVEVLNNRMIFGAARAVQRLEKSMEKDGELRRLME
jgi:hypothetical protein